MQEFFYPFPAAFYYFLLNISTDCLKIPTPFLESDLQLKCSHTIVTDLVAYFMVGYFENTTNMPHYITVKNRSQCFCRGVIDLLTNSNHAQMISPGAKFQLFAK